jgi:sodium-dependent phosphate transporter
MLCALVGSSLWVNNASRLGLPVSTSHSIVGATLGVGFAFKGPASVLWGDARHGILSIVLSWVISPLAAAVFGALIFTFSKRLVLTSAQPAARMAKVFPLYMTATCSVVISFMVIAGAPRLKLSVKDKNGVAHVTNPGGVAGVIIACCVVVFGTAYYIQRTAWFARWLASLPKQDHGYDAAHHRMLTDVDPSLDAAAAATASGDGAADAEAGAAAGGRREDGKATDTEPLLPPALPMPANGSAGGSDGHALPGGALGADGAAAPQVADLGSKLRSFALSGINADVTSPVDPAAVEAHNMATRFDDAAERLFTACQVFTASFASLAHGSNDVANAVAPMAVIAGVWRSGGSTVSGSTPTPTWCLAYGGLFIDVGLLLYGYKVMRSLGNNITYHSPSRGFSMELAALITVLWASSIGAVVSTTHVITGATVGVGLASAGGKLNAVNWRCVAQAPPGITPLCCVLALPAHAVPPNVPSSPQHGGRHNVRLDTDAAGCGGRLRPAVRDIGTFSACAEPRPSTPRCGIAAAHAAACAVPMSGQYTRLWRYTSSHVQKLFPVSQVSCPSCSCHTRSWLPPATAMRWRLRGATTPAAPFGLAAAIVHAFSSRSAPSPPACAARHNRTVPPASPQHSVSL